MSTVAKLTLIEGSFDSEAHAAETGAQASAGPRDFNDMNTQILNSVQGWELTPGSSFIRRHKARAPLPANDRRSRKRVSGFYMLDMSNDA